MRAHEVVGWSCHCRSGRRGRTRKSVRSLDPIAARPGGTRTRNRFSIVAFVLAILPLASCQPVSLPEIPAHDPIAERMRDGTIRIRWEAAPDGMAVYGGEGVEKIDFSTPVASFLDGVARVEDLPQGTRFYFSLVDERAGDGVIVAERLLSPGRDPQLPLAS